MGVDVQPALRSQWLGGLAAWQPPPIGQREMKLHVGCGSVYLRDWINVDLPGAKTFLAEERTDLVEALITDESDYYGRHKDKTAERLKSGPLNQEAVCDRYGSFMNLPARPGSIRELLARHCFEHLSIHEAETALREIGSALGKNGILRLDVPDHEGTMREFMKTGNEFFIRHLLGPRRADHGFHMMSYTRQRLMALVESFGFEYVLEEPNIHFYPAFCLRFEKQ
jgi:predicted SAM-dependent methyltransferase